MIDWIELDAVSKVEELIEVSRKCPCLIFKHSHQCGVSHLVQLRLEEDWNLLGEEATTYRLDVIDRRDIARLVADTFQVHHESPQLLLIRDGECTYDASHLDITIEELKECFHDTF